MCKKGVFTSKSLRFPKNSETCVKQQSVSECLKQSISRYSSLFAWLRSITRFRLLLSSVLYLTEKVPA